MELVERSSLILVARPQDPPVRVEVIPIPLAGPSPDGVENPAYEKVHMLYRVVEVLLDLSGRAPATGEPISVLGANWREQLRSTVAYYRDGISESPIYMQYNGLHEVDDRGAILFLDRDGPQLSLAVDGAIESLDRKAEILSLIGRLPPRIQVVPAPHRSWWQRFSDWLRGR